ncbi:MAG: PTS sugar transporter subunit IIA [Planctomycetota bacterium]|nr:PTS sugar transporter subunit IIA [Planctomycetota bacterium]
MKLSEVLTESAVLLVPGGLDKWHFIEVLTDALVESEQIGPQDRESILAALLSRERSMSTGMENGIAIPHTSVDEVEKTVVALGICRDGMDFEAIDDRPTQLVILLVNPSNRTKAHIRTLAEIARLLSSAELRTALHEAATPLEALEKIREAEAAVT